MNRWRQTIWLMMLAAATVATDRCLAAPGLPLSVDASLSSGALRTDGPVPLQLNIQNNGPVLLEGVLEIIAMADREVLAVYRTEELALPTGQTWRELVLAPVAGPSGSPQVGLRFRFYGTRGSPSGELRPSLIRVPSFWVRQLVVGSVVDGPADRKLTGAATDFLRLERYRPDGDANNDQRLRTALQDIAPADFPDDPHLLCAYDVLVIGPAALNRLRSKQLASLQTWLAAGGAAWLLPDERIEPDRVEFVNRLLEPTERLILPGTDRPDFSALQEDDVTLVPTRMELGRAVISVGVPHDVRPDLCRIAALHLWKMRNHHRGAMQDKNQWNAAHAENAIRRSPGYRVPYNTSEDVHLEQQLTDFGPKPLMSGGSLLSNLMPDDLRLVPFFLIVALLFLYVLLIGPVDYLLLGRFKLRKLTWVVFPAVTLAFTWYATHVSRKYLGGSDNAKSLIVRDVGADGRLLRENRIDARFLGARRTLEREYRTALLASINHTDLGNIYNQYGYYGYDPNQRRVLGIPSYQGRMPYRVQFTQEVPQWTPQLVRTLSLPVARAGAGEDEPAETTSHAQIVEALASINAADFKSPNGRARIASTLREADGVFLLRGDSVSRVSGREVFEHSNEIISADYRGYGQQIRMVNGQPNVSMPALLHELCVRNQGGLFGVVYTMSPRGGSRLEDVPVLDPTDPRHHLLVAAVTEGDETMLYRRLFIVP